MPRIHFTFLLGTAGAGKSMLTASLSDWLRSHEVNVATLNLDPGVIWLPYSPDVDARDYVNYDHIMRDYNLGPNGALIAAVDLLIAHVENLHEEIDKLEPDYVLADTPGQLELFAFRSTGTYLASSLSGGDSAILFLLDSNMARQPESLISTLLLSASVQYRFWKPQLNVVTKSDLLSEAELQEVDSWFEEPSSLARATQLDENQLENTLAVRTFKMLEELEQPSSVVFTSANTNHGIENLHAELQRIFQGSE